MAFDTDVKADRDTSVKADTELWKQYADEFPIRDRLIYLNHAAVAPLPRRVANAMKGWAEDCLFFGSLHYDQWLAAYEGVRVAAARLIGADRSEIAITKNTSEGIATVAMGLDWKPGDRMVGFQEEFPANYFPWKRLESKGVETTWLSATDSLEQVERACCGARLLSTSYVQYLTGFRAKLQAIGEICLRNNCIFMVDAIQGLGAFPVDIRASHIDALATDGHKWLLGPEGCGFLFISKALQDRIEPVEFGWTNVARHSDYASRDMALRPDAGRYECGTLNTIGCFGLRAAIEFLLEVKIERIADAVQELGDQIAAGVQAKGYEVLGSRTPENSAGIVSFRRPGMDASQVVRDLRAAGIMAAPRSGWVRTSPHFYISPQEIERMLEALP